MENWWTIFKKYKFQYIIILTYLVICIALIIFLTVILIISKLISKGFLARQKKDFDNSKNKIEVSNLDENKKIESSF